MTNSSRNRYPVKKPLRKDRVAIAALLLLAIILVPILFRSGPSPQDGDGLAIIGDGDTTVVTGDDETTPDETPSGDDTPDDTISSSSDRFLTYTVSDGESIADVARELGVTVAKVLASNQLFGGEQLQPGDKLYASTEGIVHIIKQGQTLTDISRTYAIPLPMLLAANDLTERSTIFADDLLLIPDVTTTFWDNVVVLSKGIPSRFIWPVEGEVVSQYGPRIHPVLGNAEHHDGIDIDVPEGTIVRAAAGGKVFYYGEQPGYGNLLIIKHNDGYISLYGHLSDRLVSEGQYVEMGQPVAQSGNTGISSGPHLHFELRNGDYPIDPERYLP